MKRRIFLKGTLAGSAVAVAVGAGLLNPRQVLAAWPKSAFEAKSVSDSMKGLFGSDQTTKSADIKIKAPDIAENGAVVPITVSTTLGNLESISIYAEKNAFPLAASYNLGPTTEGYISTRIKMIKTSPVIAVVKSGGKVYSTSRLVKVTIGGCGG